MPEATHKSVAPSDQTEDKHWSKLQESGTFKGILCLLWIHKLCGRGIFSLILHPVIAYYFCTNKTARTSSYDYLSTHYRTYPDAWQGEPKNRHIYRHLYAFGQSILDKLLAWTAAIEERDFIIHDEPSLRKFLDQDTGQLIIGSHFGNLEFCRGFVQRYKEKTINALVYDQHAAHFVNLMQSVNAESRIHIYQVDALDIPTMLALKEKIERGEWLFIAGDRIPLSGESRTVPVTFLGRTAQLPIGPYMLAKMLGCEVQLMFSYRMKKKVYFERVPFAEKISISRKNSEKDLVHYAQTFISALEKQTINAPYQWFNFYPYWSQAPIDRTRRNEND